MNSIVRLLRHNPNYALLWYAQAISLIGDWFNTIVLAAMVSEYSGNSGIAISGLLLARFLPPLIVSPLAGVLLDRFDRKRLLVISDVARMLIVLGFLLVSSADRLWLIYLFTILQYSFSAIFEPGRSALMPSVLRREDLVQANVLSSITWSLMLAIGGALGGLVSVLLGVSAALVLDAGTFLISALLISRIRLVHEAAANPEGSSISLRDLTEGIRYALKRPSLAAVLLAKFGGNIGNYDTIMIVYATVLFVEGEGGSGSLGLMWSAFGLGAILSSLLINRMRHSSVRQMRRFIIAGYALISIGWFLLGGAPALLVAALATIVKAMGSNIYWTYSSVILQKTVPDQYLGRVFSLDQAGFQLAVVLSTLVTGLLIETMGTGAIRQIVFWTCLASLVPLTLWSLTIFWLEKQPSESAVEVWEQPT
jgi:predicted MFS family arabinose efflux permease